MTNRAANAKLKAGSPDGRRTELAVLFLYLPAEQAWCPVPSSDTPDPAEDELVLALDAALVAALWSDPGSNRRSKKKLFPFLSRKGRPTGLPADAVALRFAGKAAARPDFAATLRATVVGVHERGWRADDPVLPPLAAGTPAEVEGVLNAGDEHFVQPAGEFGVAVGWVTVSPAARRRAGEYQRRLVYDGDWEELQDFLGREALPLPELGPAVVGSGEVADRSDPSARQGSEFQQLLRAIGTGAPAERERAAERLAKAGVQAEDVPSVVEAAAAADQPDRVRVLLLRAAGAALDDALGGPEAVRQTVAPKGLVLLYESDGEVRREAARLLLGLSEWDLRLRAALGEVALVVPDLTKGLDQLTVAATRSKGARVALQEQAAEGLDLSEHSLVKRLRELLEKAGGEALGQIETVLGRLEGLSFGSIEANREVAKLVRDVLSRFGDARLRCTKCGGPATLVILAPKPAAGGNFTFYHGRRKEGQYHSGTLSVPQLRIHVDHPLRNPD